ncbi:MAG: hypothetical protein IJX12_05445 [Lachnospiraceae bacterium]|nr:hypothetical protein [Lachnospiraceae bacterium]
MNKLENDFIQIDKDGTYYYGGNQKWWNSSNETMAKYGCGVIAICNLEILLDGKLRDMENDDLLDKRNIIKYSDYISIVNKSYKSKYSFGRRVPFDSLGLLPRTMKKGIESLFKKYRAK